MLQVISTGMITVLAMVQAMIWVRMWRRLVITKMLTKITTLFHSLKINTIAAKSFQSPQRPEKGYQH